MSQDFNQYDQPRFGYEEPVKGKSGCGKGCMIALIVLGVLLAIIIGLVIWVVRHVSAGMTVDPVEITKRLKERFPTAEMPADYAGKAAFKFSIGFEMDMMAFGNDDADVDEAGGIASGNALILFSFKVPGMNQEDLEDAMQAGSNGGKIIEKRPYPVRVGEYEFDGYRQKVQRRRGGEQHVYTQVIVPLGNSTMVVMQSDDDKVDEAALKQFLKSIVKDCPTARKVEEKQPQ